MAPSNEINVSPLIDSTILIVGDGVCDGVGVAVGGIYWSRYTADREYPSLPISIMAADTFVSIDWLPHHGPLSG